MEIIIGIIYTLGLIILRIIYINSLVADWNRGLDIYLEEYKLHPDKWYEHINHCETSRLKPYYYWLRLDVWIINHAINDKLLIEDIKYILQDNCSSK